MLIYAQKWFLTNRMRALLRLRLKYKFEDEENSRRVYSSRNCRANYLIKVWYIPTSQQQCEYRTMNKSTYN